MVMRFFPFKIIFYRAINVNVSILLRYELQIDNFALSIKTLRSRNLI